MGAANVGGFAATFDAEDSKLVIECVPVVVLVIPMRHGEQIAPVIKSAVIDVQ